MDKRLGNRLDVLAFGGTFVTGLVWYLTCRYLFDWPQIIQTGGIILVMIGYAILVLLVPRLRVRLDQAGDNAYYLGLLFTLFSMAFALFEFDAGPGINDNTARIISNFGIALASTIMGIFLRVFLHQMRVDPSEIESMTRIELSEATAKVRASLDGLVLELAQFHEETRQRAQDIATTLMEDSKKGFSLYMQQFGESVAEMTGNVTDANKGLLEESHALRGQMNALTTELIQATTRLNSLEPPRTDIGRRLEDVTRSLELLGNQTNELAPQLRDTVTSASAVILEMKQLPGSVLSWIEVLRKGQTDVQELILVAARNFGSGLDNLRNRLEQEKDLLANLEKQARSSAEETLRVQSAAVEVLSRLTALTRNLTQLIKTNK